VAAEKQGQADIVLSLFLVLSSIAAVGATLLNVTNSSVAFYPTVNETSVLANESSNGLGLTEEPAIPGKINETAASVNFSSQVERHQDKFNDETREYLKKVKNGKERRDYLIKFKDNVDEKKLGKAIMKDSYEGLGAVSIEAKAEDLGGIISEDSIEYIELDQEVSLFSDSLPYYVSKTGANSAWTLSNGSGVKVAILDTGIGEHDDLDIAGGVAIVDNNYYDSNGHGTQVAGVLAATLNNEGIAGTAPAVSLYSVKIMQSSSGQLSDAISGIEWAINNNMSIVSMSFGFESYSNIMKDALEEAYDSGIVLVAASGNEGTDTILYPAAYSSVIAVGATTENDQLAYFSSYGAEQELVAPGININTIVQCDNKTPGPMIVDKQ
jgi:subtilisin family serine protease